MQLFPGRTFEELDGIDIARLEQAVAARNIVSRLQEARKYFTGTGNAEAFNKLDPAVRRELVEVWREKRG